MRHIAYLRSASVILLFALIWRPALAQTPTPSPTPPVRDPQALAMIQMSLNAMGGPNAIAAVQDTTIQATEKDISSANGAAASFTWQTSGAEFHCTAENANGTYDEVSGHGSPWQNKNGVWTGLSIYAVRANQPFHIPALVLYRELQGPAYALQYIGSTTVNGRQAIQIHSSDDSDAVGEMVTPQEWYFDPATYLPLRVEYRLPSETDPKIFARMSLDFSNFQQVSGVLVPYQLAIQIDSISTVAMVSSASFNTGLGPGLFDPPTGSAQ